MITIFVTTCGFWAMCAAAVPPASQPAVDTAQVEELVRSLEAPATADRQKASERLRKLGPAVIPLLEKAAEGGSVEKRREIKNIVRGLRLRGAVVLATIVDEPADYALGIKPGDIITKVNNLSIESYEDFKEKASPLEDSPRILTVRTGVRIPHPYVKPKPVPDERKLDAPRGKLGMYLGDYDGRYGESLSTALQHLERGRLDKQWADARKNFDEAIAAGMVFDDDSMLEPIYAAICYYAGDRATAYERFNAYATRTGSGQPWWTLMNGLGQIVPSDGHLHLYFARQELKEHPDEVNAALEIARIYSWTQNRYLEAATHAMTALDGVPSEPDGACRGVGLNALQNALDAMDLLPEAAETIEQLAQIEEARNQWSYAFPAAERSGRYKAALKFGAEYHEGSRWSRQQSDLAARTFRLCLQQGMLDEAEEVLDDFDDPDSMNNLLWDLRDCDLRWAESQSMLADFARRCLKTERTQEDRDGVIAAFRILSRLTDPDIEELEDLVKVSRKNRGRWSRDGEITDWNRYLPAMLAMLKEQYPEAVELVSKEKDGSSKGISTGKGSTDHVLPGSFRKAAEFLSQHGATFTDEKAIWRRTFRAFERAAGGCYLLTRDQHIGWSDGKDCREIPLPEPVWSFSHPNWAFLVSASGKTVLTSGLGKVYKLRPDESGWDLLCSVPRAPQRFHLTGWEPVLDEFVAIVQEGGQQRDLVWPDTRPEFRSDDAPEFLMLSDGTWIGFDPVAKKWLRVPREQLGEQTQTRAQIYSIRGGGSKKSYWLFTNVGLYEWQLQSGQITKAVLPGVDRPIAVMDASRQFKTTGRTRVALFPEDGGTTFLLDESTGKLTLEGLVNEAYPETYWRQLPTGSKRKQFMEAISKAGLVWPPPVASTRTAK